MPSYLIDANLPYYFSLWNNENYIHQNDLNNEAKDSQIWEYAKINSCVQLLRVERNASSEA